MENNSINYLNVLEDVDYLSKSCKKYISEDGLTILNKELILNNLQSIQNITTELIYSLSGEKENDKTKKSDEFNIKKAIKNLEYSLKSTIQQQLEIKMSRDERVKYIDRSIQAKARINEMSTETTPVIILENLFFGLEDIKVKCEVHGKVSPKLKTNDKYSFNLIGIGENDYIVYGHHVTELDHTLVQVQNGVIIEEKSGKKINKIS